MEQEKDSSSRRNSLCKGARAEKSFIIREIEGIPTYGGWGSSKRWTWKDKIIKGPQYQSKKLKFILKMMGNH